MTNDLGFIAAQTVEHAGDGLKLFTFPGGFRCYNHSSEGETSLIYTEIFVKQEYLGTHLSLDACRYVFDVGANIRQITAEVHSSALRAEIEQLLTNKGFTITLDVGITDDAIMHAIRT